MKVVEPDYETLLTALHRQWIKTRDPKDGDRFALCVLDAVKADNRARAENTERD